MIVALGYNYYDSNILKDTAPQDTETTTDGGAVTKIVTNSLDPSMHKKTNQLVNHTIDIIYMNTSRINKIDNLINKYGDVMTYDYSLEFEEKYDEVSDKVYLPILRSLDTKNLNYNSRKEDWLSGYTDKGIMYLVKVTLNDNEYDEPTYEVYYEFEFDNKGNMLDYNITLHDLMKER